jgi:DNA polymerase-3 subunit gamma/tau
MSDSNDIFAASGVDAPITAPAPTVQPYRVLARKYRPSSFAELIGQDAMVQTLANAIARDRLAHAFLMTGVRGVGKTSTARLIAKALNCIGSDGQGGATIEPCGTCDPCISIAEGRNIDVLEIDAASNTQVEKMRDLLDNVPYAAVACRYKIYIIDEVHMLSKSSFNALLKTLEEPPDHVKFIFATTEVDKVPVTILSRCQRFDLKRISAQLLSAHFAAIAQKEAIVADDEAIELIAQAAEGSVRDGLSILDQAIALVDLSGEGKITSEKVRTMLGRSDRAATRRLFGQLLTADAAALLAEVAQQTAMGVEPLAILDGLLKLTHQVTVLKIGQSGGGTGAASDDLVLTEQARSELIHWARGLSLPVLHRLWQLLLKGHEEVQRAPDPRDACDMALLRVLSASQMPDPETLLRQLAAGGGGETGAATISAAAHAPMPDNASDADRALSVTMAVADRSPPVMPENFAELVMIVEAKSVTMAAMLRSDMRLVEYVPPIIAYQARVQIAADEIARVIEILREHTGQSWRFEVREGEAQPTLTEQEAHVAAQQEAALRETPTVKAVLEAFPGAQILNSKTRSA